MAPRSAACARVRRRSCTAWRCESSGHPALTSDAVHDALPQVWRNAARYDPARGQPRGWLVSIVRHRGLDAVARTGREVLNAEPAEQADADPDPSDRLMGMEAGAALRRCLDGMEPERRRLLLPASLDGLTHAGPAARLAQPLGTVKSGIRRALQALRQCLTEAAHGP